MYCEKYPKTFWKRTLQFLGLSSRFKRVRYIGGGGFGSVYQVLDIVTNKKYVMKVFHFNKKLFSNDKTYAQKEYYNLKNLGKRCSKYFVCPVCLYQEGLNTVILMEYLEGYQDLPEYLELHTPTLSQKKKNC